MQFEICDRHNHPQVKAALRAKAAARFLQVEMMLGNLIALQLGEEIPLIP